jgi:hypothetical protein
MVSSCESKLFPGALDSMCAKKASKYGRMCSASRANTLRKNDKVMSVSWERKKKKRARVTTNHALIDSLTCDVNTTTLKRIRSNSVLSESLSGGPGSWAPVTVGSS